MAHRARLRPRARFASAGTSSACTAGLWISSARCPGPVRIEFFGDEIESLRTFDVESQRKIDELPEVTLTLLTTVRRSEGEGEKRETGRRGRKQGNGQLTIDNGPRTKDESVLASLPSGSWVGLVELPQLMEAGRTYLERLGDPPELFPVAEALAACAKFPTVTFSTLGASTGETTCRLQVESIERFAGPRHEVLHELAGVVARDERVLLSCHNEAEKTRLAELLNESEVAIGEEVQLCVGRVQRGFRLVSERLLVLSDHELFGRTELRRTTRRRRKSPEGRVIDSFLELRENDLVVHLSHGIGRYRGIKKLKADDQMQEHLAIEFDGGVMVYVPVSLIHLVQKYVGAAKASPPLSKLGGTSWAKKKLRATRRR